MGEAQGWGCRGGTMRGCNGIYILFSVPLCFAFSVSMLRSLFPMFSLGRVEVKSKEGVRPFGK